MILQRVFSAVGVPVVCVALVAQPVAAPLAYGQATKPGSTLNDGTPIKLRLSQTVSSAEAKQGQEIPFEVMEDAQVDGVTVLAKGSTAIGVVTEAEPKRTMGRGGKLNMSISYARLVDNEKVALRAVSDNKGGGHAGVMTGAMVATSLIVWPAAPFFLFMKGKDITIPQGTEITAFIDGDQRLDMSKFGATPFPAAGPAAGVQDAQVALSVESNPAGADIEVDGNFVGNTPSTINVPLGSHDVTVKKKGYQDWTRHMNLTGGTIHLEADLDQTH